MSRLHCWHADGSGEDDVRSTTQPLWLYVVVVFCESGGPLQNVTTFFYWHNIVISNSEKRLIFWKPCLLQLLLLMQASCVCLILSIRSKFVPRKFLHVYLILSVRGVYMVLMADYHQRRAQGRIIHCAGCTMGGGPRRKGGPADQLPNFYHAVLTTKKGRQLFWER